MTSPLAIKSFRSTDFAPADQFPAWRDCMLPMFDVEAPGTEKGFFAEYDAYLVGPQVLGTTVFDAHQYGRDADRVKRDGVNHYHINLHLSGGNVARVGSREMTTGPGDITLFDFSQPIVAQSLRSELLVIAVPRDLLGARLPAGDHHGLTLNEGGGLGGILGDYMRSLAARLPGLTQPEVASIASATTDMIAACFNPTAAGLETATPAMNVVLFNRTRRYIDMNLSGEEMKTEDICRSVGISRSALYRLFRAQGGVAAYIWNLRLSRAFTTLMTPGAQSRQISDIAYAHGFKSAAHFSRAFKRAFGASPSDALSMDFSELENFAKLPAPAVSVESAQAALSTRELLAAIRRL